MRAYEDGDGYGYGHDHFFSWFLMIGRHTRISSLVLHGWAGWTGWAFILILRLVQVFLFN